MSVNQFDGISRTGQICFSNYSKKKKHMNNLVNKIRLN